MTQGSAAWLALIGTLGGVTVTAVFSLISGYVTHRWQYRNALVQNIFGYRKEVAQARRDAYVAYVVSAQKVFDKAWDLYLEHEYLSPTAKESLVADPQADLAAIVTENEARRVEAVLFAGEDVGVALAKYSAWLKRFYQQAGAGLNRASSGEPEYSELLAAMQREVQADPKPVGTLRGSSGRGLPAIAARPTGPR